MKDKVLKFLLKQKDEWEWKVGHAIENQYNPFADNGTARLEECRKELARIDLQIKELLQQ